MLENTELQKPYVPDGTIRTDDNCKKIPPSRPLFKTGYVAKQSSMKILSRGSLTLFRLGFFGVSFTGGWLNVPADFRHFNISATHTNITDATLLSEYKYKLFIKSVITSYDVKNPPYWILGGHLDYLSDQKKSYLTQN